MQHSCHRIGASLAGMVMAAVLTVPADGQPRRFGGDFNAKV